MSSKVGPSYGSTATNYDNNNYNQQQKNGYGPSPIANQRPIGYGPSPNYMNNSQQQKNGYGPSPSNNNNNQQVRNGYGPNPNYNNGANNQNRASQDDGNLYFKNPPNRTHSFKKLPKTEQELTQRYEEYQQYTRLINDYLPKEKCARCKTLKTFDCEHATPVRDDLNFNYFKTGHFYTTPKQIRELNMIKGGKRASGGGGGGVEMSRSANNLYEPTVMVSSRNDLRGNGPQYNSGPQYDSYNNINMTKSANYNSNATYASNTNSTMTNTNRTTTTNVTNTNINTTNQQTKKTVRKKKKDDDPDGCCSIQ